MKRIKLSEEHKALAEEAIIHKLITGLHDYALMDIIKVSRGQNLIATFILCSCFIEQMSTFRYGGSHKQQKRFKDFVKEYLTDYDPDKLRDDLRNKLVHNYSLGETYTLIQGVRTLHLKPDNENKTIINLENFIDDLKNAFNKLHVQIRGKGEIRTLALKAIEEVNIITGAVVSFNLDTNEIIK